MTRFYEVAGHRFAVSGKELCEAINSIGGLKPFEVEGGEILFSFVSSDRATSPVIKHEQYHFEFEDVHGTFGRTEDGFMLTLKPDNDDALNLWHIKDSDVVEISINGPVSLLRFALWVGLGMMLLPYKTVAIHSSCIVYDGKAVLFLGESGTGKSTHTRLWRENIDGAFLLNDDSPFLRFEDGKVWAYGSPWSGKTPCYKPERYELAGCVRLSQAPYNQIRKLSIFQAYGAIHPSCPPEFAYDSSLYDHVSGFISDMLKSVPFYHLACLPDADAAFLSYSKIFSE